MRYSQPIYSRGAGLLLPFCMDIQPEIDLSICVDVDWTTATGSVGLEIAGFPVASADISYNQGDPEVSVNLGGTKYGVEAEITLTLDISTRCWSVTGTAGFEKWKYTISKQLGCTPSGSGFGGSIGDLASQIINNQGTGMIPYGYNYPLYGTWWNAYGLAPNVSNGNGTYCGKLEYAPHGPNQTYNYCVKIQNNALSNIYTQQGSYSSISLSAQQIANLAAQQLSPTFAGSGATQVILSSVATALAAKNGYGTATPPISGGN